MDLVHAGFKGNLEAPSCLRSFNLFFDEFVTG